MNDFVIGKRYSVTYECRDIGYGIECGEDVFRYGGRETLAGKHILDPTNGGPTIYLFDDEIKDVSEIFIVLQGCGTTYYV